MKTGPALTLLKTPAASALELVSSSSDIFLLIFSSQTTMHSNFLLLCYEGCYISLSINKTNALQSMSQKSYSRWTSILNMRNGCPPISKWQLQSHTGSRNKEWLLWSKLISITLLLCIEILPFHPCTQHWSLSLAQF